MIDGVIAQELQHLDGALTEPRSLGQINAVQLQKEWRDLQILVETVVDICQRLISLAGQAPTATSWACCPTTMHTVRWCALATLSCTGTSASMPRFWLLWSIASCPTLSSSEMGCWPMPGATDLPEGAIDWQHITQICEDRPELIAAWAFGSSQDGYVGPGSDIDIAVWQRSLQG